MDNANTVATAKLPYALSLKCTEFQADEWAAFVEWHHAEKSPLISFDTSAARRDAALSSPKKHKSYSLL
jgi:hypothetical protein